MSQFKGSRKNLQGESATYYPGNRTEVYYNWSYEADNLFFGGELKRVEQQETTLGPNQNNAVLLDKGTLEVGYGNLTDLETQPLPLPWQFRLSWSQLLRGRNVPAAPTLGLTLMLFL